MYGKQSCSGALASTMANSDKAEQVDHLRGSGNSGGELRNKEGVPSKSQTWAEKVYGSGATKRKMHLVFHQPDSSEEMVMVLPPPEVVQDGAKEWEQCLVGYLMDSRFPPAVVSSIARII